MNKYILFLILCVSSLSLLSQNGQCSLHLNLEGKKYDRIVLDIKTDKENFKVEGISGDGYKWSFVYPDSVYDIHKYMTLRIPSDDDSKVHCIVFNLLTSKNDTLGIGSLSFNRGETTLNARFYKTKIIEKAPFYRYKDSYDDLFFVPASESRDLYVIAQTSKNGYSLFYGKDDKPDYEGDLEKYIEFTKKYPDSYNLISRFASTLTNYKSKQDIERMYNSFSERNKQSYYGQKVYKYLTTQYFENNTLPAYNTGIPEPIIQDSTKYTLVIFSASWCGPCHKQIPMLKEIYNDLKGQLEIVYITIDESETIHGWAKLMQKESIPWRSLVALDDLYKIKDAYTVQTIPHNILVHPGGYMEIIETIDEESRQQLYNQVRGN